MLRKQIADEKRKWAVKHYTHSGKPDKLKARRRVRPWEATQDPAERALKQVPPVLRYCNPRPTTPTASLIHLRQEECF